MLSRTNKESKRFLKTVCDIAAILGQATGFIVWPIIEYQRGNVNACWSIPLAVVLTSFGWWENYVDKKSRVSKYKYKTSLRRQKVVMRKTRIPRLLASKLSSLPTKKGFPEAAVDGE